VGGEERRKRHQATGPGWQKDLLKPTDLGEGSNAPGKLGRRQKGRIFGKGGGEKVSLGKPDVHQKGEKKWKRKKEKTVLP